MAIENYSKREIKLNELYTEEAICRGLGHELFFLDQDNGEITNAIKLVCKSCPLKIKCQNYAIQNHVHGIWGGTTLVERREFRRDNRIIAKEIY